MALDAVEIFIAVVEAGGFTAAARTLSMPKSTVSLRVAELEKRLGISLLKRTTRNVGLTEAGEVYFARALQTISELRLVETALRKAHDQPRGLLRIAGATNMGEGPIADAITAFMKQYPDISVDFQLNQRRVDLLTEKFDVAIRLGTLEDTSSLVARRLGMVALRLMASPEFLAAHPGIAHPRDIDPADVLRFGDTEMVELFHPSGERFPLSGRHRFTSNRMMALRHQAVAGQGIALLPSAFAVNGHRPTVLTALLPEWQTEASPLHLLYLKQKYVPARIRAFVDFMISAIRHDPAA